MVTAVCFAPCRLGQRCPGSTRAYIVSCDREHPKNRQRNSSRNDPDGPSPSLLLCLLLHLFIPSSILLVALLHETYDLSFATHCERTLELSLLTYRGISVRRSRGRDASVAHPSPAFFPALIQPQLHRSDAFVFPNIILHSGEIELHACLAVVLNAINRKVLCRNMKTNSEYQKKGIAASPVTTSPLCTGDHDQIWNPMVDLKHII